VNMLNKGTVVIGSVVAASTGFLWTAISTDSKSGVIPFAFIHSGMYVLTSAWTYVLELIAGMSQHPRPVEDMAIMALNLSIFAANTHVLGAYIERTNPTVEQYGYGWGLWGCFMFFVIFELSIYCCHRFLLHGCLYKYHKMHHARTCDGISGMDLFYMHPVDLVMQFLATSDLAYIGSGCDFVTFKFTTLLTMWMYVMAHSRIINVAMDEWDHLEHHRDGSYYHGTGVFADLLFDKKYREKIGTAGIWSNYVPVWTATPILFFLVHYFGVYAVLCSFLLPIMGHITYKVWEVYGSNGMHNLLNHREGCECTRHKQSKSARDATYVDYTWSPKDATISGKDLNTSGEDATSTGSGGSTSTVDGG